jgi:hypothetical protein
MFGFVQSVAKAFMRSGETRPPNIAGTPSSRIAIHGADRIKAGWHSAPVTPARRPHPLAVTSAEVTPRGPPGAAGGWWSEPLRVLNWDPDLGRPFEHSHTGVGRSADISRSVYWRDAG